MFSYLLKKPIFATLGICLLFFITAGIFFDNLIFSSEAVCFIFLSAIFIFCASTTFSRYILLIITLFFFLLFFFFSSPLLLFLSESILVFFIFWQKREEKDALAFLVITLSFLFHLYYVQQTSIDVRQHDLGAVLFYMKEIIETGINFMHFDPWYLYYFFHQPLHFLIAGYIYLLEIKAWASEVVALEGLQYLSLFYVTVSSIVAYALLKMLFTDKKLICAALILFSFNPTFLLFSGYISDDAPLLLLSLLSLFYFVSWQQTKDLHSIICAACFFSLGALTKLSIFLFVPAICLLFAVETFFPFKRLILNQICVFVILAVPLSLIWIMRNHLLFDMPFYNVPDTSPFGQNFNNLSLWERILDFKELLTPFIDAPYHVDTNIWLAFIKTEIFGEWRLAQPFSIAYYIGFILYMLNIFLHLAFLCSAFLILFRLRAKPYKLLLLFFSVIYFTVFLYSFKYALDYPYVCSTDYRLLAIMHLPSIILLTAILQNLKKFYLSLSVLYACLGTIFYLIVI